MKKVISIFLSLAMLLSIVSVVDFSAFADVYGDYTYLTYSDGTVEISSYNGSAKILEIPSNINGKIVKSIGAKAFLYCRSLESVMIPNSVTDIGYYAFTNCTNLISVIIPDGVKNIGYSTFEGCTSLTNITIPNSVTSIGYSAFENCTSLTSVTIPDKVTSIRAFTFYGCENLTSVTIGKSVANIGDRPFVNTKLNKVYYNGTKAQWKAIKIDTINEGLRNAFVKCTDGFISGIVRIDKLRYALYDDNTALIKGYIGKPESVIIPENISNEGYTFTVTTVSDSAFKECTSLISVTIPNSVTSIGIYAFSNCTSLTKITVPESVTSIDSRAFAGCTSLINISIPNNVTSMGASVFWGCASLVSVTIPNSVTSISDSTFEDCTSLESITMPNSLTNIGDSAFEDCTSLVNVTIPESVKSISDEAFYGCSRLKSITIGNSTESIGNSAFKNCTNLTSVTISNSIKSIDSSAFNNCSNLKFVIFNGTKSQWNAINMSSGNENLKNAIIKCTDGLIENGNTVTIDNLKYQLNNDQTASLVGYTASPENLMIPEKISYEGYTFNVTSIGNKAFYKCTSLTNVTIPDSVTNIGDSAFDNCRSLTSVTIPDSVTSIGSSAFNACSNLKSVNYNGTKAKWKSISGYGNVYQIIKCTDGIYANSNTIFIDSVKYRLNDDYTAEVTDYSGTPGNITIPESVTYEGFTFKVTSIGSSAFSGCTSLTSITIPDSVTTIGNNAFNGCSKLKKIEIPDNVTYIGSKAFDGTAFYNTVKNWKDGVLYCGNHLISAKSDVTKITVKASTVSIAAGALDNCKSLAKINVLNPKCVINCTIPKTAVIGGAEGSTAEDFAQKNNMSIDYFEECTHSDKVQVVIAATCTEQGVVQSRCADCDKLISQTFTAPLGHTMVITTPAKAPTCTTSGNTQAGYCTVCGYNEVSTVIPATGHNFGNNSANCLVCGTANPNYVAPTPAPSPAPTPAPTPTPTPTQPTQTSKPVAKPKSAKIKKVKAAKKAISVQWKKVSGVKGYQIQVATDKKFKKNKKTVTVKKQKTTKVTVKKLKAKKKYYVRIRTYKTVKGKKVYSSWSKVKTVKTK